MHKPTAYVSFAPTEVFAKAYPLEVEDQTKQFIQPTWQLGLEKEEREEPLFIPTQLDDDDLDNPLLVQHERRELPSNEQLVMFVGGVVVGAILVYSLVSLIKE